MQWVYYSILTLSVWVMTACLSAVVLWLCERAGMLAEVNARSNHDRPVVVGAGIAFIIPIAGFLAVVSAPGELVLGIILLLIISFADDYRPQPALRRLLMQAIAVFIALNGMEGLVFQGLLPFWADRLLAGLCWLWVINLTNFMDGIDELSLLNMISISMALIVFHLLGVFGISHALMLDALIIGVALLAFFPHNRSPARAFMGDAGSVPLGYLFGYLLLSLAIEGAVLAAMIMPAYYVMDSGVTLLKRMLRGAAFWQPHSEHFYQQAVRKGWSHQRVSRMVAAFNLLAAGLSAAAYYLPDYVCHAAIAAYLLAGILCICFSGSTRMVANVPSAA